MCRCDSGGSGLVFWGGGGGGFRCALVVVAPSVSCRPCIFTFPSFFLFFFSPLLQHLILLLALSLCLAFFFSSVSFSFFFYSFFFPYGIGKGTKGGTCRRRTCFFTEDPAVVVRA